MDSQKLKTIVNKYNVLYAEDAPEVLLKSKELFEELFFQVDTAVDGAQALELYKNYYQQNGKYYDIVISDIKMPNMDGIELSSNIKKINNKQKIIIISAHNESEILQNLINIGIRYFIHKPIKLDELIGVVLQISDEIEKDHQSKEHVVEVMKLNEEFEALFSGYDSLVIASRTDINGVITYVSKGFEAISGYTAEELIGSSHSIVRHPDMSDKIFTHMWETIKAGRVWKGKLKNKKKNGDYYWTQTSIAPYSDKEGNVLGYNSIREDITYQVKLNELNKKMDILLSHANDGYMLIDHNKQVLEGYSKICLSIFEKETIQNMDISELLFFNDTKKKDLLKKGLEKIFHSEDSMKNELYLSLLPTKNTFIEKSISINYKIIDDNIMIIVQDITEKVALESELEQKQKYQKMVIQVITNIDDFVDLKKDFENFYNQFYKEGNCLRIAFNKDDKTQDVLRSLHTFKGLFHQLQMTYTTDTIHNFEGYITKLINNDIIDMASFDNIDLKESFEKDLEIIEDMLGKEYIVEYQKTLENKKILKKIKYQLRSLISDPVNINFRIQNIIANIDLLSYLDVTDILSKHVSLVQHLSDTLEKPMYPLQIIGEKDLKVPASYKNFFRNLVHIYKNSVDHGIEDVDTRLLSSKDDKGKIICEYYYLNKFFHLIIKDDGQGVDIGKLTQKALSKGLITQEQNSELTDNKKLQLIFKDNLSTKDIANKISGRGVGMSSLKQSCEELGGSVDVLNKQLKGLEYHFKIPLVKLLDSYDSNRF